MANTCKWTMYKGSYSWHTECGRIQGCNVRPKQKKCYCGKSIERIKLDEISPSDRMFINILKAGYCE